MTVSRLGLNEEDEAETSSPRVLRYDGDNNHSGPGGVQSRFVEWNQIAGEEGLGFKLLKRNRCKIVTDVKRGRGADRMREDGATTDGPRREE